MFKNYEGIEMLENCALLVSSCDKNEDLWDMFFHYLHKNWEDCNIPIYLNTESKSYQNSYFDVRTFQLFPEGYHDQWSYRLKKHLELIEEDYVILILDDFFLQDKVDTGELEWCLDTMKKNDKIAFFCYDPSPGPNEECKYRNYEKKAKKAPFRMNLQAGMWNKKNLLRVLRNHEGPWQFETWGSMRSRRYQLEFYSIIPNAKRPFIYPQGGVLADNRWYGKSACHFLEVDFGIDLENTRGVYEQGMPRKTEIYHRSFLEKCWGVFKSLI